MNSAVEAAIFDLLGADVRSISPEEVARAVGGQDWRRILPQVRATAVGLARQGRLAILRHGRPVDPGDFKGVYRLGRSDAGG